MVFSYSSRCGDDVVAQYRVELEAGYGGYFV